MRRSERTAMTAKWMRIGGLLDAGAKVETETAAAVAAIEADEDRSRTYKDKMIERLNTEAGVEYGRLADKTMELLAEVHGMEDTLRTSFDYKSSDLAATLDFIGTMGASMPFEVQQRIIKDHVGDLLSLQCIKGKFEAVGLPTEAVNDAISPLTAIDLRETEIEFEAYAKSSMTARSWRPAGIRGMITKAGKAYGLDFEHNPYISELEHIRDTTSNPVKAEQISRWLQQRGGMVYEDHCAGNGSTQMAEEYLVDMRAGEADA